MTAPHDVKRLITEAQERRQTQDDKESLDILLRRVAAHRKAEKRRAAKREAQRESKGTGLDWGPPIDLLALMGNNDGVINHYDAKAALKWGPTTWKKAVGILQSAGLIYKRSAGNGSWYLSDAGWEAYERMTD